MNASVAPMLTELHDTVRALVYEQGQISPAEVDVRFESPTREWIGRLMRPTINFFLVSMQENTDLRQTAAQSTRANGRAERRMPPRRIDVRYMVSVHTTDADDEHRLIWRVLLTLLKYHELPAELLPQELRQYDLPVTNRVAQPDDGMNLLDVWGALGSDPHPAFCSVITLAADLDVATTTPLVLTRTLRFGQGEGAVAERIDIEIGGIVRDGEGAPLGGVTVAVVGSAVGVLTNAEGAFVLRNVPSGPVQLRVARQGGIERTVNIAVPSDRYDIVLA